MKKFKEGLIPILFVCLLFCSFFSMGYYFRSMKHLYKGSSISTYNHNISSTTATKIVDATGGTYYDLSIITAKNDYAIRIGSHTGINQTIGSKIFKGSHYSPDGKFYGSIYAIGIDSGTTVDVIYWVQ